MRSAGAARPLQHPSFAYLIPTQRNQTSFEEAVWGASVELRRLKRSSNF